MFDVTCVVRLDGIYLEMKALERRPVDVVVQRVYIYIRWRRVKSLEVVEDLENY